ncbi:MAG TPA: signal peptidase I [Symbiobacteriaceae bacterium]|jgi:signal peptidase|nr:signal peptidase I [Symbiobacteriaceae bacterium]
MKLLGKVLNYTLTTLLVLIIVAASGLALSARVSADRIPTVKAHKILTVLSGSMEPGIHTGDAIIIRPLLPQEEPNEGDVITFRAATAKGAKEMLITHRVAGIILVNGKKTAYVTKGDANQAPDQTPVAREAIVGIYKWRIPYFGYVSNFLRTPVGVILALVIPGLIIIAGEVKKIYQIMVEAEAADKAKAQAQAAAAGGEPSLK